VTHLGRCVVQQLRGAPRIANMPPCDSTVLRKVVKIRPRTLISMAISVMACDERCSAHRKQGKGVRG
jgi:hypothetical protein